LRPPRAFYGVAVAIGIAFGNFGVGLPLLALALDLSPSAIGLLFASSTVAIALVSVGASLVIGRVGGRNVLVASFAAVAASHLVLLLPTGVAGLVAGALLSGAATGLFWTGSMATLAHRAGGQGSERAFVRHFVLFVSGNVVGGVAAGLVVKLVRSAGGSELAGLRASFAVGLVAMAVAALLWRPRSEPDAFGARPRLVDIPGLGFALQVPAFLLVAALGIVFPVIPIVLKETYGYSALAIGLVTGAVAIARMSGSLLGGRLVRMAGSRVAVAGMLLVAGGASLAVAAADAALLFVALLLVLYLGSIGAWPITVDAALSRMEPKYRPAMSAAWNFREYAVIAVASAASGWLYERYDGPVVCLLIAAALNIAAAASALVVLQRPVVVPQPA